MENAPFSPLVALSEASALLLTSAKQFESKGQTDDAAGCYLKVAVAAFGLLASGSEAPGSEAEEEILAVQNSSLARFAELWMGAPLEMGRGPTRFGCAGETLEIRLSKDSTYVPRYPRCPRYFDRVIAAESIEEKGMVRKTRSGCGAPLVGIRELEHHPIPPFSHPKQQHTKMTLHMNLSAIVALTAGILIFVQPKLLNYIVAIYLIVVGILGLAEHA